MIKLEDVSITYKEGNKALESLNITFNKGEIVAIIGKNGSGKSSFLSAIANIIKYKGFISLDGIDFKKIKNLDFRKRVGIVFQNPNNQIIFNNVYDDLKFTLNNLKLDNIEKRVKEALKIVNMEDYINSNPYNLSMGERQRIALASVLSTSPEFLLLDEITSMIDYNGKKDIYDLLKILKKNNIGIIMGTNIIDELIYADRIVILSKRKIVKILTKEELFTNINILQEYGFRIPFVFKLIDKIGYHNLDSLEEEDIINYVCK